MLATLIAGYGDLSEWLVLFSAICFVAAAASVYSKTPNPVYAAFVPIGLAFAAVAWLVL